DRSLLVSRAGYTGEDGFEIIGPASALPALWEELVAAGAVPAGLGARDTLRTEMGYSLYGHELSEKITPLEAGLEWMLALDKTSDFPGKAALRTQRERGVERRVAGLILEERGVPRPDAEVYQQDRKVGFVTSGTYSPVLQKGIALVLVDTTVHEPDTALQIWVRQRPLSARVHRLPFVESRVKSRPRRDRPRPRKH
ncbi:MAG: glycine cleavage T C-terminal barrel domain-containing protein, partial [Candidatus Latescibacterota bacterium]|nr:glycine cleavage T C-terminal barrel domain-containing protein [Candidatus Latescibacterota bacterium]